jgi:hypothetical protein
VHLAAGRVEPGAASTPGRQVLLDGADFRRHSFINSLRF